jgi:xanthine dehydrogenase accessory factor
MRLDLLAQLNAERAARRAAVLVTELPSGEQRLVREAEIATDPLGDQLSAQVRSGKSGPVEAGGKQYLVDVHLPAPRLVVIGAVHVSQALAPMARLLGYDVTIIDPRTAFASPARFPDVQVIAEWPDVALPGVDLDSWTAFTALTHDPKIDDPGLTAALAAGCFYVGALGSKKTHAKRLERLAAAGIAPEALARIHAPIGLPINASSPAEIAVSILAEITLQLRGPKKSK